MPQAKQQFKARVNYQTPHSCGKDKILTLYEIKTNRKKDKNKI